MVSGDGANQSVTSDAATDVAGNTSAGKTVSGINIDGHEPQTTADNQCTATNGYCTGGTATVVLTATDVGPSGVKEIHYTVNGGTEQVAAGASTSVSVPLSGTGAATVKYYAVDKAGNVEPSNSGRAEVRQHRPDGDPHGQPEGERVGLEQQRRHGPLRRQGRRPGLRALPPAASPPDQVISTETSSTGLVVNGSAKDTAGNTGTDSVTVKLDKTAPTITGAIVSGTKTARTAGTSARSTVTLHLLPTPSPAWRPARTT